MSYTVFYAWQSDTPNNVNRNFIKTALERAIKNVRQSVLIEDAERYIELRFDQDTQGVPGVPEIVNTILRKIETCAIFVPDLTYVAKTPEGEPIPNPNVLLEYGWAFAKIGADRLIPVLNVAFGSPDNLPFDLKHRRWPVTYNLPVDASSEVRNHQRDELVRKFEMAINEILQSGVLSVEGAHEGFSQVEPTYSPSVYTDEGDPIVSYYVDSQLRNIYIPGQEKIFLRVIPTHGQMEITLEDALQRAIEASLEPMRKPGEAYSSRRERNRFGAIALSTKSDSNYTNFTSQLFQNLELWGIDSQTVASKHCRQRSGEEYGHIAMGAVERIFNYTLRHYLNICSGCLRISPPIRIVAGVTGVNGYRMAMSTSSFERFDGHIIEKDIIYETEISVYNMDPEEILSPFYDMIWQKSQLPRPGKQI